MLLLQLHDNVQNSLAQKKSEKDDLNDDVTVESPFLKGLEKHVKNLCDELLQSKSDLRFVEKKRNYFMIITALNSFLIEYLMIFMPRYLC